MRLRFLTIRESRPDPGSRASPARFWGRPERSKTTPCKALPSKEAPPASKTRAAFSFDEPHPFASMWNNLTRIAPYDLALGAVLICRSAPFGDAPEKNSLE